MSAPEQDFSICTGCPNAATQVCFCGQPLCEGCVHQPGSGLPGDPGVHGPHGHLSREESGETFPTGPDPQSIEQIREDLTEAVLLSLRQAEHQGLTERARAEKVVADLGTTTMITLFSGMMTHTSEGSPG